MRIRIKFEKRGSIRFSSHRDVVRILQRAVAAAGIPVAYSKGFHPHMRMSFGPPLKTGWEGLDEYVDVEVETPVDSLADRCNPYLPPGLRLVACSEVAAGVPKLANDISAAGYRVRVRRDELGGAVPADAGELLRTEAAIVSRAGGEGAGGERAPRVLAATVVADGEDLTVEYTSTMCSGRVVTPRDVMAPLGALDGLPTPARVARTVQYVTRGGEWLSPMNEMVIQGTS